MNWKKLGHESDIYTNYNWCPWYSHQRMGTWTEGLEEKRKIGDHPNYCITETGQNTEKSPGDLLSLRLQWETIS